MDKSIEHIILGLIIISGLMIICNAKKTITIRLRIKELELEIGTKNNEK